ncbi:hypothetical protein [Flavobacterium gilvum]|uniref:Lipopolysaccharide core biosynthesis protein rfaS n=1 Tax=Flavobacterium gilvum TaxID=1492737 RepID=A0AAC9N4L8_9FLAO|nr:hypothetical protein [Flavobacterium gilvum]AOW10930.1 hypothetical protein EM308_16360 [Flavobacterium gilvum]KFC60670.1 hypothetical protein FEM08_05460 [Flavobacterium gilvum]
MKITIISYDNWGLNNHLKIALEKNGHTVRHINFFDFKYKYPNFRSKLYNLILKIISRKNIKNIYYGNEILKILRENNETQDVILTIKGEFIDPKSILEFKKYTKKSIAFFNDSISRCPRTKNVITCFDEVYSFEKEDCLKYNLKFITNWIYTTPSTNKQKQYQVFNISSKDRRFTITEKIASSLKEKNINYKIIVFDKKNKTQISNVEFTSKQIPLVEVNDYLNNSEVLLDINRKHQKGLTFRVFESIGLEKKLITTNTDIINYDFYNPNNILVIDEQKPDIPLTFFNTDYEKIPEVVSNKYTLDQWIKQVFY